jgi:hypothetical protein
VYRSKPLILEAHASGHLLLITKIKGKTGKVFCLYERDGGIIGRMELQPQANEKIVLGGTVHVAISLIETKNIFPKISCYAQVVGTGMALLMHGI